MRPIAPILLALALSLGSPALSNANDLRSLLERKHQPLSARALEALIVGNTVYFNNARSDTEIEVYYGIDGKRRFTRLDSPNAETTYRIQDGMLCEISAASNVNCAIVINDGKTFWICDHVDGDCTWTILRVVHGDQLSK